MIRPSGVYSGKPDSGLGRLTLPLLISRPQSGRRAMGRLQSGRRLRSARSCRYGLPARSRAMVVCGPWPGSTPTVSDNGSTFVRRLFSMSARFPPGKSVLPIEPANKTSPLKTTDSIAGLAGYAVWNIVEPGVWPGA